jgi:hypothetical protein
VAAVRLVSEPAYWRTHHASVFDEWRAFFVNPLLHRRATPLMSGVLDQLLRHAVAEYDQILLRVRFDELARIVERLSIEPARRASRSLGVDRGDIAHDTGLGYDAQEFDRRINIDAQFIVGRIAHVYQSACGSAGPSFFAAASTRSITSSDRNLQPYAVGPHALSSTPVSISSVWMIRAA